MNKPPLPTRRTVMRAIAAGTLGGAVLPGHTTGNRPRSNFEGCQGFNPTDIGVNTLEDDPDNVNAVAKTARDPAGTRGRVAHILSRPPSRTTDDYLTLVVALSPRELTLGDIDAGATLRYDYYGGPDNVVSAPDEVWLRLEEPDGTEHIVWHHADDGDGPAAEEWDTRDIHAEITGQGLSQNFNWQELSTADCSTHSLGASLLDDFGAKTEVTRLGAGRGTISGGDVLDLYVDNPRVNDNSLGPFPP